MADVTQVRITRGSHPAVLQEIPAGVVVYEISGPLFFGAAQKAISALRVLGSKQKAVVLCMDQVAVMDATGLVALERALDDLGSSKCQAVLCGVQDQPRQLLARTGVLARSNVILQADLGAALNSVSASLRGEKPQSEATPSHPSATTSVP
jgi:SulP family sulfate permease